MVSHDILSINQVKIFYFVEHGSDITDNFSYGELTFLML